MRATATITATLLALAALTAGCSSNDDPAPTTAASSTPPPPDTAEALTPECRAWLEGELLDDTDSIDATSGVTVCGDLSDAEMDQAIEDVTDDLASQGAAPDDQ